MAEKKTKKAAGEASAETVAGALAITVSGARQHLTALVAEGLVIATEKPREPGARGRATHLYRLAPAAEPLFPKAYGELTNELLGYVADTDRELLDQLFAKRREARIEGARTRLASKRTLRAKVADGTLPAPDAQTLYAFYFPTSTIITLDVAKARAGKSALDAGGTGTIAADQLKAAKPAAKAKPAAPASSLDELNSVSTPPGPVVSVADFAPSGCAPIHSTPIPASNRDGVGLAACANAASRSAARTRTSSSSASPTRPSRTRPGV